MRGHELLLFKGGREHLTLLPSLTAAILEILNDTGEMGELFLVVEFEVVALRDLGVLLTVVTFGGLKTLMLAVELGGSVLQTFLLLSRRKSFGFDEGRFSVVLFFQLRQAVSNSLMLGFLNFPYRLFIQPLARIFLGTFANCFQLIGNRKDSLVGLPHMLTLLQLTCLQILIHGADPI